MRVSSAMSQSEMQIGTQNFETLPRRWVSDPMSMGVSFQQDRLWRMFGSRFIFLTQSFRDQVLRRVIEDGDRIDHRKAR